MFSEFVRLTPYLRGYHDRLAGQSYVVKHGEVNANVTVSLKPSLPFVFISDSASTFFL